MDRDGTFNSKALGALPTRAEAMAARLKAAGFADADVQLLGPNPRKGNLVARLRGRTAGKPIVLLAHLDSQLVARAVGNLISNGLKFNHSPRPKVEVTVAEVGPFWEVSVRDNGIGIEPRYRDQIFELFFRLNPRDEFDGSGTGLNLARRSVLALAAGCKDEPEEKAERHADEQRNQG
jgi:signal transduction histidine kinase